MVLFGVMHLLNFAHGDVYMIGAYIGYGVYVLFSSDERLLIPAALLIVGMLVVAMVVV